MDRFAGRRTGEEEDTMHVILGATGKIGRTTIATLRKAGAPVRAVLRDPSQAREFSDLGCEIAIADLHDRQALAAAMNGARAVQVICPVDIRAEHAHSRMLQLIDSLGEALAAANPQLVLAISDYGAEQSSGTGVTLIFHALEARLRKLPSRLILLRSAEHMENWSRLAKAAAESGRLPSFYRPLTKLLPTVSAFDVGRYQPHYCWITVSQNSESSTLRVRDATRQMTSPPPLAFWPAAASSPSRCPKRNGGPC
jgi:uncharacterized protein YbjT (DUF2867 family)